MTLLHPWAIWIGAFAAAGPVVVHLLTRPRPVRMPLSTLRFVREAVQQRRARHRLRDLIVLLLRTLAVLLLAWAVARPQWGEKPLISDRQAGDAMRVVILDLSQSMAATHRGIEAVERARTTAAGYLRYRPGLRANLILAAAAARPVFEEPSTNFDALRDELARCQALPQRLDVNRALAAAAEMLAPASEDDGRAGELVIVSDFQRANWAKADFSLLPAETKIQLESTAAATASPNLAILRAEGRAQSARGGSVQLKVEVGNYTPTPRKVTVEVAIGESTWRLEATCPARQSTTLTEEIQLRGQGWQSGQARLVDVEDSLAADNVRPLVVEIPPKPVYALITRQPAHLRPSSSHFLECALVPDGLLKEKASARVDRIDPSDLDASALAPANLIVLDHPGKLDGEAIKLLAALLRRGRPILYVAGELIDATNLKLLSEAAGSGLQMPVEFLPPPAGQIRRDLFLASVARENRVFDVFGDSLGAITGRLRFAGGLSSRRLEGGLEDDVLATYSDGSACVVLTSSDAGSLAVVNADLRASNLAKTPAFVPLLSELVAGMLDRNRGSRAALCGEQLVAYLPSEAGPATGLQIVAPQAATAETPDGRFGQLADESVGVAWHWPQPSRPGVYRVLRDDRTVFAMAVNVPAEESQLDGLPPEVLTGRLAAGRSMYFRGAAAADDRRDDVWKWFAVGCVVCMLGELAALLAFRT